MLENLITLLKIRQCSCKNWETVEIIFLLVLRYSVLKNKHVRNGGELKDTDLAERLVKESKDFIMDSWARFFLKERTG